MHTLIRISAKTGLSRFIILIFIALFSSQSGVYAQSGSDIELVSELYKHANTYYWYGRMRSNSLYEFHQCREYLDSIDQMIKKIPYQNEELAYFVDSISQEAQSFKETIDAMEEVCMDNANGRVPLYHGLTGHNDDYVYIDDADELAIEDGLGNLLNIPYPSKPLSDVMYHSIVIVDPYDPVLEEVTHQYLSLRSAHYIISRHELKQFLSDKNFESVQKGDIDHEVYKDIADFYEVEWIGIFRVELNDKVNGIYYFGVSFTAYNVSSREYKNILYSEAFRQDKGPDFIPATLGGIASAIIIFMIILLGSFLIKDGKPKYSFILGLGSIIASILISSFLFFILSTLAPAPSIFHMAVPFIIWKLSFSLCIIILPLLLCYFLLLKLLKEKAHHQQSIFALLMGSTAGFFCLLMYESYILYESFEAWRILILTLPVFILVAWFISKNFLVYFHKGKIEYLISTVFFIFTLFLVPFVVIEIFTFSDTARDLIIIAIPLIIGVFIPLISNLIAKKKVNLTEGGKLDLNTNEGLSKYLSEPDYITPLTIDFKEMANKIFSNPAGQINVNIISGTRGAGKTRCFKELSIALKEKYAENVAVFYGECQEFEDQNIPYIPFISAFENQLGKGRFMNEGRFGKLIGDGLTKTGLLEIGPLSFISAFIDIGEDSKAAGASAPEIANDISLVFNKLIKDGKKIVLALDDVQWLDEASVELLLLLISNCLKQGLTDKVSFITIYRNPATGQTRDQVLKDSPFKQINLAKEDKKVNFNFLIDNLSLLPDNFFGKLMESLKSHTIINYQTELKLQKYFQKIGLSNPTYYLQSLVNFLDEGLLVYQNDYWQIAEKVNLNDLSIPGDLKKLYRERFKKMKPELLRILESAAFVGECFEAAILADVWQMDNKLELLHLLKEAEDLNIIYDKSDEDDVYCFTSKSIMSELRCLKSEKEVNEESDNIPQIIKEYHKRIVSTYEKLKIRELEQLDLEILYSIANRTYFNREISWEKAYKYNHLSAEQSMRKGLLYNAVKYFRRVIDIGILHNISEEEMAITRLQLLQCYLDLEMQNTVEVDALMEDSHYNFNQAIYVDYLLSKVVLLGRKHQFSQMGDVIAEIDKVSEDSLSMEQKLRTAFYRHYFLGNLNSEKTIKKMAEELEKLIQSFPASADEKLLELRAEILNTLGGAILGDRLKDPRAITFLDERLFMYTNQSPPVEKDADEGRLQQLSLLVQNFNKMSRHDKKSLCFTLNYFGRSFFYINRFEQSRAFLEASININKRLGDFMGIVRANDSLSQTYLALAEEAGNMKDVNKPLLENYLKKALEYSLTAFNEATFYQYIYSQSYAVEKMINSYLSYLKNFEANDLLKNHIIIAAKQFAISYTHYDSGKIDNIDQLLKSTEALGKHIDCSILIDALRSK